MELRNIRHEEMTKIPWDNRRVTFILFMTAGGVWADKTLTGKLEILNSIQKGDLLLAAWTGKFSTDIFQLDINWLKVEVKRGEK